MHSVYMQLIEEITQMLNCLLNNKCQSCGYTLRGLLLASDVAILQNAHPCVATHSCVVTGKYDHKMENIVRVRPFQRHSFHIRSEKKTFWNEAHMEQNKKQNLRWLHQSHSHWGSYRGDSLLLPEPTSRSISGIRPLRSFESSTCTIDMLLFFICWLYLIPSLLFPLTEQGGSYSRPNLSLSLFFLCGCLWLVLINMVVEVCVAVQSLYISMWVLFWVLEDCLYIVSDSVWSL